MLVFVAQRSRSSSSSTVTRVIIPLIQLIEVSLNKAHDFPCSSCLAISIFHTTTPVIMIGIFTEDHNLDVIKFPQRYCDVLSDLLRVLCEPRRYSLFITNYQPRPFLAHPNLQPRPETQPPHQPIVHLISTHIYAATRDLTHTSPNLCFYPPT
jgi:hypothetical protein